MDLPRGQLAEIRRAQMADLRKPWRPVRLRLLTLVAHLDRIELPPLRDDLVERLGVYASGTGSPCSSSSSFSDSSPSVNGARWKSTASLYESRSATSSSAVKKNF